MDCYITQLKIACATTAIVFLVGCSTTMKKEKSESGVDVRCETIKVQMDDRSVLLEPTVVYSSDIETKKIKETKVQTITLSAFYEVPGVAILGAPVFLFFDVLTLFTLSETYSETLSSDTEQSSNVRAARYSGDAEARSLATGDVLAEGVRRRDSKDEIAWNFRDAKKVSVRLSGHVYFEGDKICAVEEEVDLKPGQTEVVQF